MANGIVKWFNPVKGFGFIQPEQGGPDAFVHISALERAGLTTLAEGARVTYDLTTEKGKTSAVNLKLAA
jgi:cold shock protein